MLAKFGFSKTRLSVISLIALALSFTVSFALTSSGKLQAVDGSTTQKANDARHSYEIKVVDHMKENIFVLNSSGVTKQFGVKPWLDVDSEKLSGVVLKMPTREDRDLSIEDKKTI